MLLIRLSVRTVFFFFFVCDRCSVAAFLEDIFAKSHSQEIVLRGDVCR